MSRYSDWDRKHNDCGCGDKKVVIVKEDKKEHDKFDDLLDMMKKLLKDKEDQKDKDNHKDKDKFKSCDVVTVSFDLDDLEVEEVDSSSLGSGCDIITRDQSGTTTTISQAIACLLSRGYKIVAYVAAFDNNEGALGTYTFVRC